MDLVWSRRIAEAYPTLFPRRLRQAHVALISWAEEANPDGWPTPSDVERFARLYGVPRGPLGALVGLLSERLAPRLSRKAILRLGRHDLSMSHQRERFALSVWSTHSVSSLLWREECPFLHSR